MIIQNLKQQLNTVSAEYAECLELLKVSSPADKATIRAKMDILEVRKEKTSAMIHDLEIVQTFSTLNALFSGTFQKSSEVESVQEQEEEEEEMLVDTLIEEDPQGYLDWVESVDESLELHSYRELQAELRDRPEFALRINSKTDVLRDELARILRQEQVNYLLQLCNQDITRYDAVVNLFHGNVSKGIESFTMKFSTYVDYLNWLAG